MPCKRQAVTETPSCSPRAVRMPRHLGAEALAVPPEETRPFHGERPCEA